MIENVTSEGVSAVLNYIYTSEIQLSMKNVSTVITAAKLLEIKTVLNFCKVYILLYITNKRTSTNVVLNINYHVF